LQRTACAGNKKLVIRFGGGGGGGGGAAAVAGCGRWRRERTAALQLAPHRRVTQLSTGRYAYIASRPTTTMTRVPQRATAAILAPASRMCVCVCVWPAGPIDRRNDQTLLTTTTTTKTQTNAGEPGLARAGRLASSDLLAVHNRQRRPD